MFGDPLVHILIYLPLNHGAAFDAGCKRPSSDKSYYRYSRPRDLTGPHFLYNFSDKVLPTYLISTQVANPASGNSAQQQLR